MAQIRETRPSYDLTRAPASDVKKKGWRGMMKTVSRTGKLLVTHHNEPEAVILSLDEYDTLRRQAERSAAGDEAALDTLRRRFDKRMAALDTTDADKRLRQVLTEPAKLHGKVKAGTKR